MEKWEYQAFSVYWDGEKEKWRSGNDLYEALDEILDREGDDGWELVSLAPRPSIFGDSELDAYFAVFKRRKP